MRISRKLLSVALSTAMLVSQAMPVMATAKTEATANILDYTVEAMVVPTTLKIALNPNGYEINTKYEEATAYNANADYYVASGEAAYVKATVTGQAVFDAGTYYTPVVATDQVVSLNYGIVNKSTEAKTVTVAFTADYTAKSGKKAIEYVNTATGAAAYDKDTNPDGAKKGEYKIYLAVASASALPTANTYAKTTDASVDASKTYYIKDASGAATKVDTPEEAGLKTYYEVATAIGTEITPAELADVTMTKADDGNQAFKKGTTNKATASISYKLDEAAYSLKDGEFIDFDTKQTELAQKLEMSGLGGVAGFTLTGAVNANADWTSAEADAITITPIYALADVTGSETDVQNTYNQVITPTVTLSGKYSRANATNKFTLADIGDRTVSKLIAYDAAGKPTSTQFATGQWSVNAAKTELTVNGTTAPFGAGAVGQKRGIGVVLSDETEIKVTFTVEQ